MKQLSFALLLSLVSVGNAFGGALQCSNATQTFRYSFSAPDGGASIAPTTELTVDGNTVISEQPFGGEALHLATLEFRGPLRRVDEVTSATNRVTYYVQRARVTSTAAGAQVLFDHHVYCQQRVYIGPPIP